MTRALQSAHFRIHGGYPERYGGRTKEILVSNFGFNYNIGDVAKLIYVFVLKLISHIKCFGKTKCFAFLGLCTAILGFMSFKGVSK